MSIIISFIEKAIDIITAFNECVTFSQWLGSLGPGSNGTEKQELKQDYVLKLQSSIQRLRDTLPAMCKFINQVEWKSHDDSVAELLPTLKAAVYDAEDLLEDFRCYEQKVNIEGCAIPAESDIKFFKDFIEGNFNTKLTDIKERLDDQVRLLEAMGLHQTTPRFDNLVRPETTRLSTEPKIFGRGDEVKELIRLLGVPSRPKRKRSAVCSSSSNQATLTSVSVLPIVGIGGVGKTTLAQSISNNQRVGSHFDKIAWICVSDDFNVKRLTEKVIEQLSGKAPTKDSLDSLYADLADILKKTRFLIVLDDIWDENEERWKRFCAPFKHVLQGSMMLVTTRSQKVADIVRTSTMDPFALEGLKDDDLWKFFKLCAFRSDRSNNYQDLEPIGKQILPKLKGSPLAAKTIGRLLRTTLEPAHWNSILESQMWKTEQKETDILPALRLSYIYLPFPLKRCFSFCAVYPKDYNFVKEDLAEIWVAQGFVEPGDKNIPLQQIACNYFEELEYLSFFQKLHGKYVMHDLIHDMAQLVSKDECFIIRDKMDIERIPRDVRHLLVLKIGDVEQSDLMNLCKQTKLRTLICFVSLKGKNGNTVVEKWCTELSCTRVMVCASISKQGLPNSISNMKNLRYLKILDFCTFNGLPAAFCRLYNMQLLSARKCGFEVIPRGFSNLINLQKFESKSLRVDAGLLQLDNFDLITGDLSIYNICEINKDQAAKINRMMKKEYISRLTLRWSSKETTLGWYEGRPHWPAGSPEHKEIIEVFQALQPSGNIKSVRLECYPGDHLPSWFHGFDDRTNFSSLTEIMVIDCPWLSRLEQLLQPACMPAIKRIDICNCTNLESVEVERFGPLPSLEVLLMSYCPKINSRLVAPSLKSLSLQDSGNLGDDIDCRSLTSFLLSLYRLPSLTLDREKVPLLTDLTITQCSKLETLNGDWPLLESLEISFCPNLKWGNGMVLPSSLQKLDLWDCGYFSVRCLENLTSLKALQMSKCKDVEYIPRELWSSNLQGLQEISIVYCEDLVSIGGPEAIAHIPEVRIQDCPKLKEVQQPLQRA